MKTVLPDLFFDQNDISEEKDTINTAVITLDPDGSDLFDLIPFQFFQQY